MGIVVLKTTHREDTTKRRGEYSLRTRFMQQNTSLWKLNYKIT